MIKVACEKSAKGVQLSGKRELKMNKILVSFFAIVLGTAPVAGYAASCGAGYVLVQRSNIDGIKAAECQKLWCRDLETGKNMGSGKNAASGYKDTSYTTELCDADRNCVECFGERKWCAGEVVGEWNPEYGAYTRGGDNASYQSYQKGGCFAWRLEKPNCDAGYTAVLSGGEWVCTTFAGPGSTATAISKSSSTRRTSGTRRGIY